MAEKFKIEIFKEKNAEEFTLALADPDSKLQAGSASAATAALAGALICRASCSIEKNEQNNDRYEYLRRNGEIFRKYMVHLIDEDVRARGPLRRAKKEGDARAVEAALQTSIAIQSEIISMCENGFELIKSAAELCDEPIKDTLREAAMLLMTSAQLSAAEKNHISKGSCDDTFRFVVKRENELTLQRLAEVYESIQRL